jgi:hypothetical protein
VKVITIHGVRRWTFFAKDFEKERHERKKEKKEKAWNIRFGVLGNIYFGRNMNQQI